MNLTRYAVAAFCIASIIGCTAAIGYQYWPWFYPPPFPMKPWGWALIATSITSLIFTAVSNANPGLEGCFFAAVALFSWIVTAIVAVITLWSWLSPLLTPNL